MNVAWRPPPSAREIDMAERILAAHGFCVVPSHIAEIIERWELAPASVSYSELQAAAYVAAVMREGEGGLASPPTKGPGTGGGGSCAKFLPPFAHHQKRPF